MKTLMIIIAMSIGFMMGVNDKAQAEVWSQDKPQSQQATKTMISNSDLMNPIKEHLASQYNGWAIVQAYRVDTKGVISYKVVIKKDTMEKKVLYDSDGKFLKEAPIEKMQSDTQHETNPPKQD